MYCCVHCGGFVTCLSIGVNRCEYNVNVLYGTDELWTHVNLTWLDIGKGRHYLSISLLCKSIV